MQCRLTSYLFALSLLIAVSHAGVREKRCYGIDDYKKPRTCLDLWCRGSRFSGVYKVYPDGTDIYSIDVFCDQESDGGGWTVFQRRMDGWVDFYRSWQNYKLGFGNVNGEHWLGNDILHHLLGSRQNELRVDLEAVNNEKTYAMYDSFNVGNESSGYVLHLSGYSGTTGESMIVHGHGSMFTTLDRDQDTRDKENCAVTFHGAWWYGNCHNSNLNGNYHNGVHKSYYDGVNWGSWKGAHESLKTTEMKFRAKR